MGAPPSRAITASALSGVELVQLVGFVGGKVVRDTLRNVALILTMRCDQASWLISNSQERELNGAERCALSFHLLICRVCRKYRRQLAFMRNVLRRLKEPELHYETVSSLIDEKESGEMRGRISKKIHEKLDST
ncbi:MAG: anti-sigma factor family protein [Planctomycetota bacterium]